jgi:ribosome-associated heat shock protein Hsp15
MTTNEAQRIDKWLWHARFAKTRTAAQHLATSGHVRVNREKIASASRLVRVGDVVTLSLRSGVKVVRLRGIDERRGSAGEARRLYDDATLVRQADGE